ncbi:MAG: tRNA pseudouridine(54/55) synthase Pus10 [Thermoplasmata archaeon]
MLKIPEEINELCDHCLGRIYASLGHGLTNQERGKALRVQYCMDKNLNCKDAIPENCYVCNNLFDSIDKFVSIVINALKNYEFNTFLIGSRIDYEILKRDKDLNEKYGNLGESIKNELDREVGKRVSEKIGKDVSLENPDITVILDSIYESTEIIPKPIFIYGRYRKFERGMPQTRWIHEDNDKSIEEYIGEITIRYFDGKNYFLHGSGREDVDVLMLGNGRPFILEISKPRKRFIDLKTIENDINSNAKGKIEVFNLRYSTRDDVKKIKEFTGKKIYRLVIELENDVDTDDLIKKLESLEGKVINQRTPLRIIHKRSDIVREKKIHSIKLISKNGRSVEIEIEADPGTYIKEFANGDEGRTKPSISGILDQKIKIERLDVVKILDSEE